MLGRQFIAPDQAVRPLFVGIDLGGTSVKIGLVDDAGRALCWHAIPTQVEQGPEEAARRMGQAVREVIQQAGVSAGDVAGVGLGSPGILDYRAGTMVNPTNFPGWNNFPIRQRVADHCGLPVTLANDASAAAYGEFWSGAGKGFSSLVMLTLGTGVGCGVIIGDLIIEGEHGHGTECGHIIVDPGEQARVCSCGQTGHLEAYASATAVVARTHEAIQAGRPTSLTRRLAEGIPLSTVLIAEEAEAGDPLALEIVMETARWLGIGIVTLLHTIDPSGVLIGGAMTFEVREGSLARRFLQRIREEVRRRAFPILAEKTSIEFATLGADAGFIGAAGIARVEHRKAKRKALGAAEGTQATRAI